MPQSVPCGPCAPYLVELGVQGATELHVLHQVGALALVGGDDADLVGLGPSLEQLGGDLLHVGSLGPAGHTGQPRRASPSGLSFEQLNGV